jgi:hypothetical protein
MYELAPLRSSFNGRCEHARLFAVGGSRQQRERFGRCRHGRRCTAACASTLAMALSHNVLSPRASLRGMKVLTRGHPAKRVRQLGTNNGVRVEAAFEVIHTQSHVPYPS